MSWVANHPPTSVPVKWSVQSQELPLPQINPTLALSLSLHSLKNEDPIIHIPRRRPKRPSSHLLSLFFFFNQCLICCHHLRASSTQIPHWHLSLLSTTCSRAAMLVHISHITCLFVMSYSGDWCHGISNQIKFYWALGLDWRWPIKWYFRMKLMDQLQKDCTTQTHTSHLTNHSMWGWVIGSWILIDRGIQQGHCSISLPPFTPINST